MIIALTVVAKPIKNDAPAFPTAAVPMTPDVYSNQTINTTVFTQCPPAWDSVLEKLQIQLNTSGDNHTFVLQPAGSNESLTGADSILRLPVGHLPYLAAFECFGTPATGDIILVYNATAVQALPAFLGSIMDALGNTTITSKAFSLPSDQKLAWDFSASHAWHIDERYTLADDTSLDALMSFLGVLYRTPHWHWYQRHSWGLCY
jgi:hypothetical protein